MKTIILLICTLAATACNADWGIDFYRYQCVPELGRIYFDTFYIENPDEFGSIRSLKDNNEVFENLAKNQNIFAINNGTREFACQLGQRKVHISVVTLGPSSQGEYVGRVIIKSGAEILVDNLSIFAYYGYSPQVTAFEIVTNEHLMLISTFEVYGGGKRPDFVFDRELFTEGPVTNDTVRKEAQKHP